MLKAIAALTAFSLLAPALASAHPSRSSEGINHFRIIDRPVAGKYIGADLSVGDPINDETEGESLAFRLDINGHFLVGPSAGLYGTLPIATLYFTGNDALDSDSESALGALELGGFFVVPIGASGHTDLVLRGGLALPTADDDLTGFAVNALASVTGRVTDLVLVLPDAVSARVAGSIVHDTGSLAFRIDGGIDIPVLDTDEDDLLEIESDPILRLNAGVAFGEGPTKLVFEIANLIDTNDVDQDEDVITQVAGGFTSQQGDLLVGLSASVVLDSVYEEDDGVLFAVIGSLGTTFGR